MGGVKRWVVTTGCEEAGDEQVEHREVLGQWKYSVPQCHDGNLWKPPQKVQLRVNPNFRETMDLAEVFICQYRFINCIKCPTLVGMLMVGKSVHVCRGREYTGNLCTSLSTLL